MNTFHCYHTAQKQRFMHFQRFFFVWDFVVGLGLGFGVFFAQIGLLSQRYFYIVRCNYLRKICFYTGWFIT